MPTSPILFLFQVAKECFIHFQKVIDILRFLTLFLFEQEEVLDVEWFHIFNLSDVIFLIQVVH